MTKRQRRIVEAIERKGYQIDRQEMIGKNLFVCWRKGENVLTDVRLIGTIGPRGRIRFTRYYFGGQRAIKTILSV